MVVGLASKNGHRAVDLLDGHYSYHLVGERHLREGEFAVCPLIDSRTETVRAADDEDQVFARAHFLLQEIRKLNGAELAAVFIEQEDVHGGGQKTKNSFSFCAL